jgi:hypothetical protein
MKRLRLWAMANPGKARRLFVALVFLIIADLILLLVLLSRIERPERKTTPNWREQRHYALEATP